MILILMMRKPGDSRYWKSTDQVLECPYMSLVSSFTFEVQEKQMATACPTGGITIQCGGFPFWFGQEGGNLDQTCWSVVENCCLSVVHS